MKTTKPDPWSCEVGLNLWRNYVWLVLTQVTEARRTQRSTPPDSQSPCHTQTVALWLPTSGQTLRVVQLLWKTRSCQSNSASPSLRASVSLSSSLFVAMCSQLRGSLWAGLGGPVWNVLRRGEAGRPKRGCSIVPTHSIHPPLICRSLGHLGRSGPKQGM